MNSKKGEKIIAVFENPSNIEKLLVTMEDKIKEIYDFIKGGIYLKMADCGP